MVAACKCKFKRTEDSNIEDGIAITTSFGDSEVLMIIAAGFVGVSEDDSSTQDEPILIANYGMFVSTSVSLDWTMAITSDETMPTIIDDTDATVDEHITQREREARDQDAVKSSDKVLPDGTLPDTENM